MAAPPIVASRQRPGEAGKRWRPGRRGRCRASPPSEPDVRALPHPVPRVTGSLRDVSAPDPRAPRTTVAPAPVWLSAAVALTQVMELRVSSRVSRQRLRSRGAPLPSAGSRWPRFPVFNSTMKALRLPTLRPSGLLFSPVSTMCARSICVVARALPMPRRQVVGPGFEFRAGCTPDRPSFTWTVSGLSGSLVTHPLTLQRSPTPEGP